jgi:hypothetical protein
MYTTVTRIMGGGLPPIKGAPAQYAQSNTCNCSQVNSTQVARPTTRNSISNQCLEYCAAQALTGVGTVDTLRHTGPVGGGTGGRNTTRSHGPAVKKCSNGQYVPVTQSCPSGTKPTGPTGGGGSGPSGTGPGKYKNTYTCMQKCVMAHPTDPQACLGQCGTRKTIIRNKHNQGGGGGGSGPSGTGPGPGSATRTCPDGSIVQAGTPCPTTTTQPTGPTGGGGGGGGGGSGPGGTNPGGTTPTSNYTLYAILGGIAIIGGAAVYLFSRKSKRKVKV